MNSKLKLRKGDKVIVTNGKSKGVIGEILKVLPKENRALVRGANIVKKHTKPTQNSDGKINALENYSIKCMSIGFLIEPERPMIWRGPMIQSALQQLIKDVDWGELDFLIVDMPPGTGDVQLTMTQKVNLSGAIIVSTPQDIALQDAIKGINMFKKVNVPVIGLIENMSYYICPKSNEKSYPFGNGGAEKTAKNMNKDIDF